MLLHDSQELDNDLGGRSDQDLTLASLLGVVHGIESVVENGSANHLGGIVIEERFSNRAESVEMRYLFVFECEMNRNQNTLISLKKKDIRFHHSHSHGLASYEQAHRAQRVPFSTTHLGKRVKTTVEWVLQPVPIMLREKRIIAVFQDDDCLSRASQLRDLKSLTTRETW